MTLSMTMALLGGLALFLYGMKLMGEGLEKAAESDVPAEIQALVDQRREARKAKNFALADELRDKIAELGWVVEETRQGTKIYKK